MTPITIFVALFAGIGLLPFAVARFYTSDPLFLKRIGKRYRELSTRAHGRTFIDESATTLLTKVEPELLYEILRPEVLELRSQLVTVRYRLKAKTKALEKAEARLRRLSHRAAKNLDDATIERLVFNHKEKIRSLEHDLRLTEQQCTLLVRELHDLEARTQLAFSQKEKAAATRAAQASVKRTEQLLEASKSNRHWQIIETIEADLRKRELKGRALPPPAPHPVWKKLEEIEVQVAKFEADTDKLRASREQAELAASDGQATDAKERAPLFVRIRQAQKRLQTKCDQWCWRSQLLVETSTLNVERAYARLSDQLMRAKEHYKSSVKQEEALTLQLQSYQERADCSTEVLQDATISEVRAQGWLQLSEELAPIATLLRRRNALIDQRLYELTGSAQNLSILKMLLKALPASRKDQVQQYIRLAGLLRRQFLDIFSDETDDAEQQADEITRRLNALREDTLMAYLCLAREPSLRLSHRQANKLKRAISTISENLLAEKASYEQELASWRDKAKTATAEQLTILQIIAARRIDQCADLVRYMERTIDVLSVVSLSLDRTSKPANGGAGHQPA